MPPKQPNKGRLWLSDGACVRLRPLCRNHVWSYDFVHCRPDDGRPFRTFNIIEEYSRECLVIKIERRLNSTNVIDALQFFSFCLGPLHTFALTMDLCHCASGQRFDCRCWHKSSVYRAWKPMGECCCESFNGRFRDELLNGSCYTLRRPKSSLKNGDSTTIQKYHTVHWAIARPSEAIVQVDYRPNMQ